MKLLGLLRCVGVLWETMALPAAAGSFYSMAIKADGMVLMKEGTLWTWDEGYYDEPGLGGKVQTYTHTLLWSGFSQPGARPRSVIPPKDAEPLPYDHLTEDQRRMMELTGEMPPDGTTDMYGEGVPQVEANVDSPIDEAVPDEEERGGSSPLMIGGMAIVSTPT